MTENTRYTFSDFQAEVSKDRFSRKQFLDGNVAEDGIPNNGMMDSQVSTENPHRSSGRAVNQSHEAISERTVRIEPLLRGPNVHASRDVNGMSLPTIYNNSYNSQLPTVGSMPDFLGNPNNYGNGSEQKTIFDFFKIALKHRNLIGACLGIAMVLAVAYAVFTTRSYNATATIRIDTYLPVLPGTAREDVIRQKTVEKSYFATQVADLRSLPLADKVLSVPKIHEGLVKYAGSKEATDKFKKDEKVNPQEGGYKFHASALKKYLSSIRISPIRETSLVKIIATSVNPKFSALIANEHAGQFISRTSSNRMKEDLQSIKFLEKQVQDLGAKLIISEKRLADYTKKHALVSVKADGDLALRNVDSLSRLYENAVAKRIEAENGFKAAKEALVSGSTSVDDDSIVSLRRELSQVESQYLELGQRFTPEYPRMKELRSRMNGLKSSIKSQRKEALMTLKANFASTIEVEEQLMKKLEEQKKKAFKASRAQVDYNRMEREYESLKELHQNVLVQLQQTQLRSGSEPQANISIVEPAAVPDAPSSPKPLVAIALALVGGPFFGLLLAFLFESMDKTIKTPEELEDLSKVPGLGIVPNYELGIPENPHVKHSRATDDSNLPSNVRYPLITLQKPYSLASEAFRTIRAGVRLSVVDKPVEVILVTSSDESEGKSTLVSNLGVVCAHDNARTLLIDADLRRPSLFGNFNVSEDAPGLAEVLTDQKELEDVVRRTAVERLDVLPAGGAVPNPAELVGSQKMQNLIRFLRKHYDYIIIDTPPIMPVADSLILSRAADGVIMVARANKTIRDNARTCVYRMLDGGARVLGMVLNDVDIDPGLRKDSYLARGSSNNPRFSRGEWSNQQTANGNS